MFFVTNLTFLKEFGKVEENTQGAGYAYAKSLESKNFKVSQTYFKSLWYICSTTVRIYAIIENV